MNGVSRILTSAGCEGGFNWYGFLIGSAMVVCILIAYQIGTRRGYYKDLVFDICIVSIPLAIVGARLYYVIFDIIGNGNSWTFKQILGIGSGGLSGLAIYGGLIGAVCGGIIVHFWKRKKPPQEKATFWQMADLAFTVIILGQAIGRWGNFANQEAYGNLVTDPNLQWFPYAVFIDAKNAYYQATFFYESFLNCIGFALLMWIYCGKRKSFDGFSLSVYCIYYGTVRVCIEGLRSDSLYLVPGVLRVSQLLSGILIVFGIGMILAHLYRARAAGKKPFIFVDKAKLDGSYFGYEQSILSHPNVYDKTKKEKGFFAKMFARVEDTPDPEDALPETDGEAEEEKAEEAKAESEETQSEETDGAEPLTETLSAPDDLTVSVAAQDAEPLPPPPVGAKRPRGN